MWLVCTILTFLIWGIADLFYKKSNDEKEKYSHLKTGAAVGLIMGIHATLYILFKRQNISFMEIIKYLPVSMCYILSMVIGYKGLKYVELSVSSPIQNTSGVITSILLCIIFKISLSLLELSGIIIIFIGLIALSLLEMKYNKISKQELIKNFKITVILFPIIYCIIDGVGTFLDSIYLDQKELISEDAALVAYEYTFLIYGIILYIFLKLKKVSFKIKQEKNRLLAAVFETLGQFTYVFAITKNSFISIPIISCYSIVSIVLSRLFLKEKLTKLQYIFIMVILIGIILLSFSDC